MEDKKAEKKKSRPAQKLYVPPAQRSTRTKPDSPNMQVHNEEITNDASNTSKEEQSLVIMLNETTLSTEDKNIDLEKQEMERVISNINRKTRPIIKHVNVGNNDVLRIDLQRKTDKPKVILKDQQVANWEDLFNEDDDIVEEVVENIDDKPCQSIDEEEEEEEQPPPRTGFSDLEHVIELYDFPPSFKTQDLVQLYHEVNKESMYVKWCDETHALLVFSTPTQANMALQLKHDIIKSRRMGYASAIACQVATKCDLKPALRRPQTSMQTARRMITSHLGTGLRISKEEQAREREQLRKAKELKRAQKQSEYDAWEGNPRPSTA